MIRFDFAARFGRRPLDLLATTAGFLRGEEATEPPVAEPADAAKRCRCGSAQPDVERFQRSRFDIDGTDRQSSRRRTRHLVAPEPISAAAAIHRTRRRAPRPAPRRSRVPPESPTAGRTQEAPAWARDRPATRAVLSTSTGMAAWKHRDRRAHLQIRRPGQCVGHPNERIDRLGVHQL